LLAIFSISAEAAAVPEPFAGHDPNSTFRIKYSDVDTILKTMVVDVGRSTRKKAQETHAKTGTRMKKKVKRETANEGNRFFYEEFENNQEYKDILHQVRLSLEAIPSQVPLATFNRKEQLAYWLNLYNVTVLDVLVQQYPERDLKKELIGKKSFLDEKILNVAGVPLSLNDIQYTILAGNYDNDPRIMYGLYQGNIGGPNIRKHAYSGENVDRFLQDNAEEFVNSNRGTAADEDTFEVSTLYERNSQYFPSFDRDLKEHLMRYISGPERSALQAANTFKPDIDDWTITDVYGTDAQIGGSFTDNKAAMLDSVDSISPDGFGGTVTTNFSVASSKVMAKTPDRFRVDPELLEHLGKIKQMEESSNLSKEGTVTVEEMGEVQEENPEDQDDQE
jgi:hypothetical protein